MISMVSVFGVVGRIQAVDDGLAAVDGEIAVQLDHGVVRLHEIVAVNLDFVVICARAGRTVASSKAQIGRLRSRSLVSTVRSLG